MKSVSKLLKTVMVATLSLIVVGFGVKTPSIVISNYFDEVKKGDRSNELLKLKSSSSVPLIGKNQEEMSDEARKLLLQSLKKIEYTINNENINGEQATVNVTVKGPNITNGMVSTIQESFKKIAAESNIKSYMSEEEGKKIVDGVMIKHFKQLEIDERTADVMLVKNNDEWTVNHNEDLCNLILGRGNI